MNESHHVWPLKHLLCPKELTKLKAIKHRYHMWKDYSKRKMSRLLNGMQEQKKCMKEKSIVEMVATKQGVPKDFWFKPYTGKFSGEKFA